jgi:hypothetical protein
MKGKSLTHARTALCVLTGSLVVMLGAGTAQAASSSSGKAKFSSALAFDISRPARDLTPSVVRNAPRMSEDFVFDIRPERRPIAKDRGFSGDGAMFPSAAKLVTPLSLTIQGTSANFEGISNQDNFNLFGGRVNPPDPVGDVGPNHYVEMSNLAFAVYDKQGNVLLRPTAIGDLWEGFPIEDCTDPSGDPVVLYDQLSGRWILSQFTTRGLDDPTLPFYNCVAVSQTEDPTGAYYRYAFSTGYYFPDYPKYGVWTDSYILTTREFGPTVEYGIGVYALEKNKMIAGNPNARAVSFFIDGNVPANLPLVGDGLLPPDVDGTRRPVDGIAAPIVGTQDDDADYGATKDALNIWELTVQWKANPVATLEFAAQLPVASFDSVFPCAPTARDCLPQPGITNPAQFLDVLSYRQRPTYRLAYRNFGKYEALVTNQSVEAAPGVAGVRWYEIRRVRPLPNTPSAYELQQQGTYAPSDGVHRWMGSAAMDWQGNIALGYSVVNGTDVYPGIRYTGRLAGEPLGTMGSLGEGTIINGTGVQRTTNSRWGDYTSLNVDPTDDCTFWYVNEYYTLAGQLSSTAGWQTRIASFKLPGCVAKQ